MTFSLDPRLAADTVPVADLSLSSVLLMQDANYPWLILVPRRHETVEVLDLDPQDQETLWEEIRQVAGVLREITTCHKLNIATLGNSVRQLHIHVIARQVTDPAWPSPVWGRVPPRAYDPGRRDRLIASIRARL